MCVVVCKPAGIKWPGIHYLKNCFLSNPDGAGIAWVDEAGINIKKGYFTWECLWKDLKDVEEYPVLLHCRVATEGSITKRNCHPFLLKNGIAMAHNGIINIEPLEEDMTDSETFGKKFIEPFTVEQLSKGAVKELLEAVLDSSKIAMLTEAGTFIILNEVYGQVFQGLWFSNTAYLGNYFDMLEGKWDDYYDPFFVSEYLQTAPPDGYIVPYRERNLKTFCK